MIRRLLSSLRTRLLLLILLAFLPALGLVLYTTLEARHSAAEAAEHQALLLAQQLSARHTEQIESARQLLAALAELSEAQNPRDSSCSALLAAISQQRPLYTTLAVAEPNGEVVCSGAPLPGTVNLSDREYFQRVLATRRYAVSDYLVGRVTGKAAVMVSYPVLDDSGQVQGVVLAGLDLEWLGRLAKQAPLPEGTTVTVIDRNNTVLARYPDPEGLAGKQIAEPPPVVQALSARPVEGVAKSRGLDGRARLYAYFSLGATSELAGAYVLVGIPEDVALAAANRLLTWIPTLLALTAAVALVAGWTSARLLIVRPIMSLVGATGRLAGGDLTARSGVTKPAGEIGQLASAFDSMASSLETKERQRREAEEGLHRSEALYRSVVSLVDIAVVRCDLEGRRTFVSDALVRRYGRTAEELLGRPFNDHLEPKDVERASRLFGQCVETLTPITHNVFRHVRDGKHHYTLEDFTPLFGADGQATGVQVTSVDVTHLIETENQLRQSEELYRGLVEAGPAVIRSTRDGKWTFASQRAAALYGTSQEALLAGTFRDTILPEDMGKIEAVFQEVFERRRPVRGLVVRHRIAGEVRHISTNWEPVKDAQGNVVEVQNIALDITDQRRLEEQYQQAQKMESVGRLAGGVAHDFNNLLTVILGYAELCVGALPEDSPLREHVREITVAGERAASLTRQLLAFSRRQIVEPRVINLNELVANMHKMLQRLIGEDVELVTLPTPDLWPVKADPGQVEQVLANLAVNARDAMPQGGKLTIKTANVTLDESYASTHHEVTPGDYVMLSVSDTGVGMTEEVKAHLFEPFFTTKKVGEGTGLGLATCYGIVKQAGGHIGVYSETGQGTAIKVYLPRVHAEAEALEEQDPVEILQGIETVLVVEDEAAVRAVAVSVLRAQGYTVLEAERGAQALRVAEEHPGPIHLLLTDVVMPEMSGRLLAEQLAARRPDMKVLYTSGYTADAVVHHGVLDEGTHFLQKPFSVGGLARKVRQVLDEGEEQP